MVLEKGSLILIDYTAKVKETDLTFETTREEEAKKSDLYDMARRYEPRLISVTLGVSIVSSSGAAGDGLAG